MAAGASVKFTDNRKLQDHIRGQVKRLRGMVVTVGVHGTGSHGRNERGGSVTVKQHDDDSGKPIDMPMLAAIHEFGTDKIPERSFIRAGIDAGRNAIANAYDVGMAPLLTGEGSARRVCDLIGVSATSAIKGHVYSGLGPPLAESTKLARIAKTKTGRKVINRAARATRAAEAGSKLGGYGPHRAYQAQPMRFARFDRSKGKFLNPKATSGLRAGQWVKTRASGKHVKALDALASALGGVFKPLIDTGQLVQSIAYEVKGAS